MFVVDDGRRKRKVPQVTATDIDYNTETTGTDDKGEL